MEANLILSPAPHIHTKDSSRRIMLDVIIALLPASCRLRRHLRREGAVQCWPHASSAAVVRPSSLFNLVSRHANRPSAT